MQASFAHPWSTALHAPPDGAARSSASIRAILLLQENQHGPRRAGSAKPSVQQPVSRDVAILSCCWQPCPLADLHISCTRHRVRMPATEALCSLGLWPHNRSLSCSPPTCTRVCPLAAPPTIQLPERACTMEQTMHLLKQTSCTAHCRASHVLSGQMQTDKPHPSCEAVSGGSMSPKVLAADNCACFFFSTMHSHTTSACCSVQRRWDAEQQQQQQWESQSVAAQGKPPHMAGH